MSSMLEQAIVDARALREAAEKSAEAAIVEKYSEEVKAAVGRLLEADDDLDLGMDFGDEPAGMGDMGAEAPAAEPIDSTAMEQVPMAHLSDEEEVVVVDLDDMHSLGQDWWRGYSGLTGRYPSAGILYVR